MYPRLCNVGAISLNLCSVNAHGANTWMYRSVREEYGIKYSQRLGGIREAKWLLLPYAQNPLAINKTRSLCSDLHCILQVQHRKYEMKPFFPG